MYMLDFALAPCAGSGKSTALRLIFRFYDPLSGGLWAM